MAAYLKLQGIDGESTDKAHDKWIIIESMSAPIMRSIPGGARDQQRTKGETTLGDIVVVRQLDKSSVPLQEKCAKGDLIKEVEIHFCTQIKDKQEAYLKYKLFDVIISSFSIHANSAGSPLPSEQITLSYSKVEWNYVTIDPKTGDNKGNVPGSFDVSKNSTK